MQVIVRSFNPAKDAGIILSSYPKGVYYGSYLPINPRNDYQIKIDWFKNFYEKVQQQFKTSTITVACVANNPDFIIGYCISTGPVLEWVYVKKEYRFNNVATLLVKQHHTNIYANITKVGAAILQKKGLIDATE